MAPKPKDPRERFWSKVDKNGPVHPVLGSSCWLWIAKSVGGSSLKYGMFWDGKDHVYAHRFAWELEHGPIGRGVQILHSCDRPLCVRHLFDGTQADNVRDMVSKGRQARGDALTAVRLMSASRGHEHYESKLSFDDVANIRRLYGAGDVLQRELADRFGVSQSVVSDVLSGKTYR